MVQEFSSESSSGGSPENLQLAPMCLSKLCSFGMRPLLLTGFFKDFLIRHFSSPLNIEDPDLRHLVWNESERSDILIESIHRWRPQMTERRPAILVKRNSYQNVRKGINDLVGITEQGHEEFGTLWVGSHTLFCINGTGASAEILATEVQRELTQFGSVILRSLDLHKFRVHQVGAISELEESTENFVVPITVGWAYEESWQLPLTSSLPIRRISMSILIDP